MNPLRLLYAGALYVGELFAGALFRAMDTPADDNVYVLPAGRWAEPAAAAGTWKRATLPAGTWKDFE